MNIKETQIRFNQPSVSKLDAIQVAGKVLLDHGFIEEAYIDSMIRKEDTDNTYIGNGIAIPHGLYDDMHYVKESGISVIHYPNGIQYGDAQVFIVIGIAAIGNEHIEILQNLAIKLSELSYVEKLIAAKTESEFYKLFNE